MADVAQAPVGAEGTTVEAPDTGAPDTTPAATDGHGTGTDGSTATGHAASNAPVEDSFFDRSKLVPELVPAYKEMQSAFTKRMQSLSAERQKVDAYDAFMADPATQLQQLAAQYGYTVTRAQAAQAVANTLQGQSQEDWAPSSWDEVTSRISEAVIAKVQGQFKPVVEKVQALTAQQVEGQLDHIDPQWRVYEDAMRDNLKRHPTLVQDIQTLYRLSVPAEVIEARATQAALARIKKDTTAAKASGASNVRSMPAAPQIKSFDDAVAFAKEQLARR